MHSMTRNKETTWRRSAMTVVMLLMTLWSVEGIRDPFRPERIKDWIRSRCGESGSAIWVYEGGLYDPLDGKKIANIEGLELVRHLADTDDDFTERCSNLKARELKGDFMSTVLSRRLFCYQSPQQPKRLLNSIRLRPNAPLRKIPTDQAVAWYDTATTYVSRNKGGDLVLHTEWPNRKCLWATATSSDKQEQASQDDSMDFTLYTKPNVKDLPPDAPSKDDKDTVVSPKRSQLVQFGSSLQEKHKFGARETYSYIMDTKPETNLQRLFRLGQGNDKISSCRVRYTRYGEGPPWYGAGKYCMLELQGRRVDSVEEAPPVAATFAAQNLPGFLAVHTPITSNAAAQSAVDWFRRGTLQQIDEDEEDAANRQSSRLIRGTSAVWKRIREASTLVPSVT